MPYTPQELMDKLSERDAKVSEEAIKYIDGELQRRFNGTTIYIDRPKGLSQRVFKHLRDLYAQFNWCVTAGSSRNEEYLEFAPIPVEGGK